MLINDLKKILFLFLFLDYHMLVGSWGYSCVTS